MNLNWNSKWQTVIQWVGDMPSFTVTPVIVLNTCIEQVIGDRFVAKCGQTEREKEETISISLIKIETSR